MFCSATPSPYFWKGMLRVCKEWLENLFVLGWVGGVAYITDYVNYHTDEYFKYFLKYINIRDNFEGGGVILYIKIVFTEL